MRSLLVFVLIQLCGCLYDVQCPTLEEYTFPKGEYRVTDTENGTLIGSEAIVTDETITITYTDGEGNQWEVVYSILGTEW